jgi:hypothetical protein
MSRVFPWLVLLAGCSYPADSAAVLGAKYDVLNAWPEPVHPLCEKKLWSVPVVIVDDSEVASKCGRPAAGCYISRLRTDVIYSVDEYMVLVHESMHVLSNCQGHGMRHNTPWLWCEDGLLYRLTGGVQCER